MGTPSSLLLLRATRVIAFALLATLAIVTSARANGELTISAQSPDATHITVQWNWYEFIGSPPIDEPQWTGFDLYRTAPCGPSVRLTEPAIARIPNQNQGGTITDTPPLTNVTYSYKVVPVDAARNWVYPGPTECSPPCVPYAWASAPQHSAVVTAGTIQDWGWTLYVQPCSGSCVTGAYIGNLTPDLNTALRAYLGTGQTIEFYGDLSWGSIEGVSLTVDHYQVGGCGPVPTRNTSWGRLKTLYR